MKWSGLDSQSKIIQFLSHVIFPQLTPGNKPQNQTHISEKKYNSMCKNEQEEQKIHFLIRKI